MAEKFFDRFFMATTIIMFFICTAAYNIAYFNTLGDSIWYFFYIPITVSDMIKTGLAVCIPMLATLLVFKPILIDPAFNRKPPSPRALFISAVLVLVSNLFYFTIFIDSPDHNYSLISESAFYIFSFICLLVIVYYFSSELSQTSLLAIFFISLIPIAFLIGVIDAKFTIISSTSDAKSQILLDSNKVVNANVLRSFDKGIFLIINNNTSNVNFISWDEIKEIKFKKVTSF